MQSATVVLVAPGPAAGVLQVDGNYTQTVGGLLDMDIAGPASGIAVEDQLLPGADQLAITGDADLAGTLASRIFEPDAERRKS